jgi:hypothetical protein
MLMLAITVCTCCCLLASSVHSTVEGSCHTKRGFYNKPAHLNDSAVRALRLFHALGPASFSPHLTTHLARQISLVHGRSTNQYDKPNKIQLLVVWIEQNNDMMPASLTAGYSRHAHPPYLSRSAGGATQKSTGCWPTTQPICKRAHVRWRSTAPPVHTPVGRGSMSFFVPASQGSHPSSTPPKPLALHVVLALLAFTSLPLLQAYEAAGACVRMRVCACACACVYVLCVHVRVCVYVCACVCCVCMCVCIYMCACVCVYICAHTRVRT